jgi:hypothetical protein
MEMPKSDSSLPTADTQATDKKIWIAPRLSYPLSGLSTGSKAAALVEFTLYVSPGVSEIRGPS